MATVIDDLLVRLGFDPDNRGANLFERRLEGVIGTAEKFNQDMAGLRNAALAAGAAVGAVLYKATSAAIEFESAMADVKKVVDFDTPDGLVNMREELLELSTQIPITAEGFAQIAAAAGQSGIAANEITAFAEAAAKMGTAFDISADQAGQAMAEMRVAFKMSQDEVGGLVDQINYLGDSTPNSAAKILQIVQRIGPLGEIAGVSAEQIAAMGASITALEPEIVSTGLKNMMINLTKGTSATEAQEVAFGELGFTAQGVASGMQKNSKQMIDGILGAIKNVDADKQAAIINTIFGAEALPVVAQLITNGEMLEKNLNAVGDASLYAGSAQREFETRSATTANQIELLKNNLNVAAITVGDIFLPAIGQAVEAVTPLVQAFADWAKENPELIKQILLISGAVIGVILAISGIGLAVSAFLAGLTGLGAVLGMVAGGLSLLLSPIGLIIIAIGVIIGLLWLVYKNWAQIVAGITAKWDKLTLAFNMGLAVISAMWSGFWSSADAMASAAIASVINKVKGLASLISGALNSVKSLGNFKMPSFSFKPTGLGANNRTGNTNSSSVTQNFNVSSANQASLIAKNSIPSAVRNRNNGVTI